jgi:CheY-like chemotaxis protein
MVLDVLLEGEHTWELLAELKQAQATRDIPVYVVTLVENEAKAVALGADGFCLKPVERAWLLEKLKQSASRPGSGTILLIDDDEASRYLLKDLLSSTTRLVVTEAASAQEGVCRAQQEQPRVVFLDLDLPDRSGVAVLEELRGKAETRKIPVIIHTSQVLREAERRRLAAAGAVAILSKERPSREAGLAELREALRHAGIGDAA